MWKRALLLYFAGSVTVFGQTIKDYSGVFLQTQTHFIRQTKEPEDPIVLKIDQESDSIHITEFQNGTQVTYAYDLRGRPSPNISPPGVHTMDRVRIKDDVLLIRSESVDPAHPMGPREEVMQLYPDLRVLSVRAQSERGGNPKWMQTAEYTRQENLEEALGKAAEASRMNNCVPGRPYIGKRPWKVSADGKSIPGLQLGGAWFDQVGWTYSFDVSLGGDFFRGLEFDPTPRGVEIRRNGNLVSTYSGNLVLIVRPAIAMRPRLTPGLSSLGLGGWRFTDDLRGMRFHIAWRGSQTHDLGEVPAELKSYTYSPTKKLTYTEYWYEMEIPASDAPITNSLEIHVLSPSGMQFGCVNGSLLPSTH